MSLALAEVVLRVAGISFPVLDTYDEMRGVALKPGKEGWRVPKPAHVRANGKLVLKAPPISLWRRFLYTAVHHSRLLELVNEVRRIRTAGDVGGPARETRRSPGVYAPPVDAAWQEA